MRNIINFVRTHFVAVGLLTLSSVAALWFAGNLLANVIYFNDPRHKDETLKPWMSPRYVVMSYNIPRPLVADLLGVDPEDMRGKNLRDIAAENNTTLDALTIQLREGVAIYRANQK